MRVRGRRNTQAAKKAPSQAQRPGLSRRVVKRPAVSERRVVAPAKRAKTATAVALKLVVPAPKPNRALKIVPAPVAKAPRALKVVPTPTSSPAAVATPVEAKKKSSPRIRSSLPPDMEAIKSYFITAQMHPPLSREDEYALSRKARAGDAGARRLLVNHNVAFVLSMCRRWQGRGCRMDDLVQEGMIGLLKAVEHFDADKGNRFSTYASWWIRAYVQKFVRDMRATVKPIVTGPGDLKLAPPRDFSLDAPIGDDDDTTYLDRLIDVGPGSESRYSRAEKAGDIRDSLEKARKRIGGLGWDVIEQRLSSDDPRTLEEIGKDWGLSRERVRQVEKVTKEFLTRYLEPLDE